MDFKKIESKWQNKWDKAKVFQADVDKKRKKFFITFPYPYLNGGPHIGATFTFGRCDAYARFKRMQGFNVLFPQGFHATGEPILGTVERLINNDKDQIETFKLYGATDKQIEEFKKGPEFVAKFWMKRWIEDLKMFGYSADWRRTFVTAITPTYNRFIEWQYNTLRRLGYVTQGTHPVIWCPHCQSPTGDHDRLRGEGESPIEYVILKFKLPTGEIIPTGTLRPETIYGVTNIWINPEIYYVWTKVGNEIWLLSEKAAEKLKDQLKNIQIIGKVKGSIFVGKSVENLATKTKVLILPANFVDPDGATGVVMSVPSHAPFDWVGLRDLQKDLKQLKKYNVDLKEVGKIRPISIIKTEGFGEHPAVEISDKMLIISQNEKEKLDGATSVIYKKEYHTGVLKENTNYAGKKVSEVKEKLISDFITQKIADKMWETTGTVVCRCKTLNHVKILENQWFLKFSDKNWKEKVKKCVSQMKFYPEEARHQFLNTIDWLDDKACARKAGLGTRLPWDKEWIVETLSDSVIYMAYYTIARILNEKKIPAEDLTDEVFDAVLLGKGSIKQVSRKSKLSVKVIEEMRDEFDYFYPVDHRNSGKDLVQNHLTYFLFHHVAMWNNPKYWPKSIGVNGFVNVSGQKMSKRFGNVIPLRNLMEQYGADLVRMNIISANENMDDADWNDENLSSFESRLNFLQDTAGKISRAKRDNLLNIDLYLQSRIQKIIKEATENFEATKLRSAVQSAFFNFINELRWYLERCARFENCNKKILTYALNTVIKLITPLLPHFAEEIWHELGNKNFVAVSDWPNSDKKLLNETSELKEELVKQTLEDIRNVQKITKTRPKEIRIIIAPQWKFEAYSTLINNRNSDMKKLIGLVFAKTKSKEYAAKYVQSNFKKLKELPESIVSKVDQSKIFREAEKFIEKQVNAKIVVEDSEESKIEKAKQADVLKPAIFIT